MREVWLVRHGAAEGAHPGGDPARRLTPQGRAVVERVGRVVASWGIGAARGGGAELWASPYARADETARLLAPAFGARSVLTKPELVPEASPDVVAQAVWASQARLLVVVAHLPVLPGTIAILTGARLEMGTATMVHLAIVGTSGPAGASAILGVYPAERILGAHGMS